MRNPCRNAWIAAIVAVVIAASVLFCRFYRPPRATPGYLTTSERAELIGVVRALRPHLK